jgi:hypothetical protein
VGIPTIEHVIFIPAVILVGMVLGYVMGKKAALAELDRRKRRARE